MPEPLNFEIISNEECKLVMSDIQFSSVSKMTFVDIIFYVTVCDFYANDKLIYTINQQDDYSMISGGYINYISMYRKDNKIIFLNKFTHDNHHLFGARVYEVYHFTPVFDITKL